MQVYVTFFSVGTNSEALIIDHFQTITEEIVVWESKEQYFAERSDSFDIIDGGMHVYYLAAGVSAIPDALLSNQIVSYRAPSAASRLAKGSGLRRSGARRFRLARMARGGGCSRDDGRGAMMSICPPSRFKMRLALASRLQSQSQTLD